MSRSDSDRATFGFSGFSICFPRPNERGLVAGTVPESRMRTDLSTRRFRRSGLRVRWPIGRPEFFLMRIRFETPIESPDHSCVP